MFRIGFIVFRELLEIVFLLSILMAVTQKVEKSRIYITGGIVIGVFAASIFAFFAKALANSFSGIGDEIFSVLAIGITILMITSTVVLMQDYVKRIHKVLDEASQNIHASLASRFVLTLVAASTVFREAIEIIIYLYSLSSVEKVDMDNYLLGFTIGALSGGLFGVLLYYGLARFSIRRVFQMSTILLTLIAAALSAELAGILTSSGIIEIFSQELWDTSGILDDRSNIARLLRAVIGYTARPNLLQVISYFTTIFMVMVAMLVHRKFYKKNKITLH